jgi:hypothetical protein
MEIKVQFMAATGTFKSLPSWIRLPREKSLSEFLREVACFSYQDIEKEIAILSTSRISNPEHHSTGLGSLRQQSVFARVPAWISFAKKRRLRLGGGVSQRASAIPHPGVFKGRCRIVCGVHCGRHPTR